MSGRNRSLIGNCTRLTGLLMAVCLSPCFGHGPRRDTRTVEPLPVESVVRARYFGEFSPIAFSPDGKLLAYTVRENQKNTYADSQQFLRTGVPWYAEGADIYVLIISMDEAKNLTGGVGNNWLPTWSPDNHFLAFLSDRDGSGQAKLWIWDALKDRLRKVSDVAVRAVQIEWTPDSQRLLVTTLPSGSSPEEYLRKLSSSAFGEKSHTTVASSATVTIFRSGSAPSADGGISKSEPWNLDRERRDLAIIEVASGRSTFLVTDRRIDKYLLSPDASKIAFTTPKRFERSGSQQTVFDLVLIPLPSGTERVLASDISLDYDGAAFNWSPDGSMLSFHAGGTEERNFDCFVVDLQGGKPRDLTLFPPGGPALYKASPPIWDTGGHIYFIHDGSLWRASVDGAKAVEIGQIPGREIREVVQNYQQLLWLPEDSTSAVVLARDEARHQDAFYKIDLTNGTITRLSQEGQCLTCAEQDRFTATTSDGRQVAYFAEDAEHAPDLWLSDAGFRRPRRITQLNPQFAKYDMGTARLIDWMSADGERLQGALLLPAGYREGTRYPLIVYVYGGHALSDYFGHFGTAGRGPFNMQLLATRGYAVLLPDSPQHAEGTAMADLTKTVLPGVNKAIELGIADPKHIGVMGQSNGGFSTLSLIVQTKRFKAAIDLDGFGDLIGLYGGMDSEGAAFGTALERVFDPMGGTPWEFRDRYIENSPVFYLDRVETPLLIVHGEHDTYVPPFLADEVFVGLRRLGREVEYAKYHDSGHDPVIWSYANQLDLCKRMITWFDKYLKSDWPTSPSLR